MGGPGNDGTGYRDRNNNGDELLNNEWKFGYSCRGSNLSQFKYQGTRSNYPSHRRTTGKNE